MKTTWNAPARIHERARTALAALSSLGFALMLAAPAAADPLDIDPGDTIDVLQEGLEEARDDAEDESGWVQEGVALQGCAKEEGTVPVTPVITGNGGVSQFQLYQQISPDGKMTDVFASWSLSTNSITNGADLWAFGVELRQPGQETHVNNKHWDFRGGVCQRIGIAPPNFNYFVNGGAGGWVTESSCAFSISWSVTVGISISYTGPSGSASATLGGSLTCSNGAEMDTEILFRDVGQSKAICLAPCIG